MSKDIDPKTVKHIAGLSRIELGEKEIPLFAEQFARILAYFHKLAELDTELTDTLSHPGDSENVTENDNPSPSLTLEQVFQNAPDHHRGFFIVPKILGDS